MTKPPHCSILLSRVNKIEYRTFVESKLFERIIDDLIFKGMLTTAIFRDFQQNLLKNPKLGKVIPGLAGLRKTRLKSSHTGKRGGFRVDYIDISEANLIHLLVIYPKSVKTDLSPDEKRIIKTLVLKLKKEAKSYE